MVCVKKILSCLLGIALILASSNFDVANVSYAEVAEQMIFHHTDQLSGTSIDTDETGSIVEAVDYYPFGEIRIDQKTGSYENKHKFTGKEFDETAALYYYGARYYDPTIGRFISADPVVGDLANPQSLNKYSYVVNNPLKYVDVTGNMAELVMAAGITFTGILSVLASPVVVGGAAVVAGVAGGIAIYESYNKLSKTIDQSTIKTETRTKDENDYITLYRGDVPGKNGFLANGIRDGNIFAGYLEWIPGENPTQSLIDMHRRNSGNSLFISTTTYRDVAKEYAIGGSGGNKTGMVYKLRIPKNKAYSTGHSDGEYLVPFVITGDKIVGREYVYPHGRNYKKIK